MSEIDTRHEQKQPEVLIELAKPEDAEALYDVRIQTWLATYPNAEYNITEQDLNDQLVGEDGEVRRKGIESWRKRIEDNDGTSAMFVARLGDRVIGFTAPRIQDDQRRLGALYVLPEAQGLGIGTKLIKQAIAWHGPVEDVYLHVASYNTNAISFYQHMGFELTGNTVTSNAAQLKNGKTIPELEMVRRHT